MRPNRTEPRVCLHCRHIGIPVWTLPGSLLIEVLLWVLFFPAGIVYTLYRRTNGQGLCAKCGGPESIPLDTPRGQELAGAA